MKSWTLLAVVASMGVVSAGLAQPAAPALCVGIGAARIAGETLPWESRVCASARADAEAAFRELVPGAAAETHLYSRPVRWDRRGVLLTDGVTDNQSIPVTALVLREGRWLVEAGVPPVFWLAGIGEVNGAESWLYDRMGGVLPLDALLNELPANARLILRAYPDASTPVAHTLYLCDAGSASALREWARGGGGATDALPGLSWLLQTMTPIRLHRVREQLAATGVNDGERTWIDLGRSLERVEQEVGLGVTVWERPIFRKERKPGPFFTIVEVETDEVIGMDTRVDTARLANELNQRKLGDAVVREVLQRIDGGAAASFEDAFKVGPTTYSLVYDKDAGNMRIRYLD